MAGEYAQDQTGDTPRPPIDGSLIDGSLGAASPVLVGGLVAGRGGPADDAVEWTLWPVEVYASGALLRVRLTRLGPWREFAEPWTLHTTVTVPASLAEHYRERSSL